LTPRKMAWREFSPVTICFAIILVPPNLYGIVIRLAQAPMESE
jgi:hypothetical protein